MDIRVFLCTFLYESTELNVKMVDKVDNREMGFCGGV